MLCFGIDPELFLVLRDVLHALVSYFYKDLVVRPEMDII